MTPRITLWLLLMSAWTLADPKPRSEPGTDLADVQASICHDGYTFLDGHCYYFSNVSKSWYDGYAYCATQDAHLATVSTDAENAAIKTYLLSNFPSIPGVDGWWFGGTDAAIEGHWVWVSDQNTILDRDWCSGDPNNDNGEHCVSFNPECNFQWNDRSCNFWGFRFICEKYVGTRTFHPLILQT